MLWYQRVLEKFNLDMHRIILVADPDGILQEESILGYLTGKDFEIVEHNDPVAFRYVYEAEFRDQAERKLIVQVREYNLNSLPYDVQQAGVAVSLSLAEFFPRFSYPVLKQLDTEFIGALYQAYSECPGVTLGDQGTREFVLQHIYELVPSLIKNLEQFTRVLLSLHYRKVQLPADLVAFIDEKLQGKEFYTGINGSVLLANREDFWSFLQEQWSLFIQGKIKGASQALVPFEHDDIRVYIDNLFNEGILTPVAVNQGVDKLPEWAKAGITGYQATYHDETKLKLLIKKLDKLLYQENLSYQHWLKVAPILAEAKITLYEIANLSQDMKAQFNNIYQELSKLFKEWLLAKYGTLSNLPYIKNPVMVHHIPKFLGYQGRKADWQRLALVVLDGMAWDQWVLVKKYLLKSYGVKFEEGSAFAWVPTMTSVSRQAIFAGEPPRYFKDSLFNTSKEEHLWKRFWENEGFKAFNIKLVKGLGDGDSPELDTLLSEPKTKILGLVVDKIDKMVHGQQLGTKGMHQDIELWMQGGYLQALLEKLFENKFRVYLTSDHGNIEAVGQGKLNQGALVTSKGERFRIYQASEFMREAMEETKSIEWPNKYGLPDDLHILLAENETAYIAEGKSVVSHGGISMEEIVVPFIKLWKEEKHR